MSSNDQLKQALEEESKRILSYWESMTQDDEHGGFYGRIDACNQIDRTASKGVILNTRILWAFSAAGNHSDKLKYSKICDRAYDYLLTYFFDNEFGGVVWELDYLGNPVNNRKQIYAQAFAMYALCEYYQLSGKTEARDRAMGLFDLIEQHSKDQVNRGYFEAFSQKWQPLKDMRLSKKDMNTSKTMNTHLHIMEAYTSLLKINRNERIEKALRELVILINHQFLTEEGQFHLFFDDHWNLQSQVVSYGHDIESAWLILEAARQLEDEQLLADCESNAMRIVNKFLDDGIGEFGGVLNEYNYATGIYDEDRHWWPQVEAMLGLGYAYQLTGETVYLKQIEAIWNFINEYIIDKAHGEWYFRVNNKGIPYEEDIVSMWKAPYHSVRACIYLQYLL